MPEQAVFGQLFPLGAGTAVIGVGIDGDASAGRKEARHLQILGIHQFHQVFHDGVHAVFVEISVVAETEQIELQALGFYHFLIRNIADTNLGKVRLTGDGAQGGELRAVETHPIVVVLVLVLEGFQYTGIVCFAVDGPAAQGLYFFSVARHYASSPASLRRSAFSAICS